MTLGEVCGRSKKGGRRTARCLLCSPHVHRGSSSRAVGSRQPVTRSAISAVPPKSSLGSPLQASPSPRLGSANAATPPLRCSRRTLTTEFGSQHHGRCSTARLRETGGAADRHWGRMYRLWARRAQRTVDRTCMSTRCASCFVRSSQAGAC